MSEILRRQIEKITPLTDQEFEYILSHFTLKKFKKHQILIQEGDTVQNDYFVMNGLLNPNSAIEKKEYFSILISNCVAVEKNKR